MKTKEFLTSEKGSCKGKWINERTVQMTMIVLMQNDYPIGIYTKEEIAQQKAKENYLRMYRHTGRSMEDFHYRTYAFEVDK